MADGKITLGCLTRSSVNSERDDLANAITALFELLGASVEVTGDYPGWQPKPDSPIVEIMSELYGELFGESAHVAACHAGLECGIVGTNYPDTQMISFGPNIRALIHQTEQVANQQRTEILEVPPGNASTNSEKVSPKNETSSPLSMGRSAGVDSHINIDDSNISDGTGADSTS